MKRQQYIVNTRTLSSPGEPIEANCIDITFINYGVTTLIVNSTIRIPPPATVGQFNWITISGNDAEIDRTKYTMKFEGVGVNDAVIIWREYKEN